MASNGEHAGMSDLDARRPLVGLELGLHLLDPRVLGERLEGVTSLDAIAQPLYDAVQRILPVGPSKDLLHGVWLGHPVHPPLTDLVIGFWTSAWVLDLASLFGLDPQQAAGPAAEALVALGVSSAAPTAVTGLADWSELSAPERRAGAVHAVANATATALYAGSWMARRRGHRGIGVALGMLGATAATAGGFLGGHLVYRRGSAVNHTVEAASPTKWTEVKGKPPTSDALSLGVLDGTPLACTMSDRGPLALADQCSHLGGPLHEGDLVDGCVRCPWHGSTFRLEDGRVVRGPAVAPQPAYELRRHDGRIEARRRPIE
jgi:nitrite reductase/ring-hydroxylating ferredoxin subunit/uncharacterized membrane protein